MSAFECQQTCGYRASSPPKEERCARCGQTSSAFGEFCDCGYQDFCFVCPNCGADVVVDHPDTVRP